MELAKLPPDPDAIAWAKERAYEARMYERQAKWMKLVDALRKERDALLVTLLKKQTELVFETETFGHYFPSNNLLIIELEAIEQLRQVLEDRRDRISITARTRGLLFSTNDEAIPPKRKISKSKAKRVMERDLYRCKTCGDHLNLTIDHIHPVSKGGGDEEENLQTLCRTCNSRKGNRTNEG